MELDTVPSTPDAPAHTFKPRKQRHARQARPPSPITSPSADILTISQTEAQTFLDNLAADGEDTLMDDGNNASTAEASLSVAEILRKRKTTRARKGGLDFSNTTNKSQILPAGEGETMAERTAVDKEVNAVVNRFTHQTGAIVDVDEHMMKYIETEIERRRLQDAALANAVNHETNGSDTRNISPTASTSNTLADKKSTKVPAKPDFRGATLGKLQEIDLGAEHTQKNIERTEEMKRRIERGEDLTELELENSKKRKRRMRRRNSVDIERDKMVEEVLKESRLDIYEEPEAGMGSGNEDDDDFAADDRIAEQFRREFLDALNARRRGRTTQTAAKNKKEEKTRPRGPKLGGSRAARAAMRESEKAVPKK